MLNRIDNPNHKHFGNYGGRGIAICDDWRVFDNFAADMSSGFSPSKELDRIDNNGDYCPENCRWADRISQQRNRRNNHIINFEGLSLTVQEWGERLGVKPNTIITRLRRGWPVEDALLKGADRRAFLEIAAQ